MPRRPSTKNRPKIAIVTDSTASLDPADAEREGIEVIPLKVIIGADEYVEGDDVTSDMIAEALAAFVPVSTSRPTSRRVRRGLPQVGQERGQGDRLDPPERKDVRHDRLGAIGRA